MKHTQNQDLGPAKENKILRLSMAVLFMAFVIVYFVLYYIKGDQLSTDAVANTWALVIREKSPAIVEENPFLIDEQVTWFTSISTWNIVVSSWTLPLPKASSGAASQTSRKILSGTTLYYGEMDFVEKLWISYAYALKDSWTSYFVYMWKELKYDFSNIARKLWGNLYVMNTEQEIIKNKLFGQKIIFINIPEYKNKIVLMLAYIDQDIWLIKMDYANYHASKTYLQHLFTDY